MRFITSLLLSLSLSTFSFAQVGVNTDTPSQALDVMGKIQIADDATAPERGTIRFNDTTSEFEGYDGTEWKVLSMDKTGGTPTAPIPYNGRSSAIQVDNASAVFCTFRRAGALGTPGVSSFTQVLAGKHFLVTVINVEDNNLSTVNERIDITLRAGTTSSRFEASLRLTGSNFALPTVTGDSSNPLLILRPGENVRLFNNSNSQTTINVNFRGFLVDDLDF